MALTAQRIEDLAGHLDEAELACREVAKITQIVPEMDWADAYDIQWAIRRRKELRGNRIVGMKMGLTSRAKMRQMDVDSPIYGFLADYFSISTGAEIQIKELIHPKVEAEIAFVTKTPLRGPGCTVAHALAAIDFALPAIEVIDSRYENFRFDLKSVIADNASSARFVTGGRCRAVEDLDLKTLGVVVEKNGEAVALGAGAAVLGHPALSLAMLANMLAERGEEVPAGTFIMTGGITEAIPVVAGDVVIARFQDLGQVSVRFS